jgi:HEAT repeat protein
MKRTLLIISILSVFTGVFAQSEEIYKLWEDTMKFGISKQRITVMQTIANRKVTNAYGLIKEALINDDNASVRGQAVFSLREIKINTPNLWLTALQKEKDDEVLGRIVSAIGDMKIESGGEPMFNMLREKINETRSEQLCATIIRAIGNVGYRAASSYILELLTDVTTPLQIRNAAAVAIGDLGTENELLILENLVNDTGEARSVRMYSAYAMGKSGNPNVFDILSPIIENENEDLNVRLWAIAGLGYIKDEQIVKKMIGLARVDNTRIRMEAVKALGKIKDPRAEEMLKFKALHDPEHSIKQEAIRILKEMGVDTENLGKTPAQTKTPKDNS